MLNVHQEKIDIQPITSHCNLKAIFVIYFSMSVCHCSDPRRSGQEAQRLVHHLDLNSFGDRDVPRPRSQLSECQDQDPTSFPAVECLKNKDYSPVLT